MSYAPQYPYGPMPQPKKRRSPAWLVAGALALVLLVCGGIAVHALSGSGQQGRTITTVADPVQPSSAAPARSEKPGYSAGAWKVPSEVKPGTYVTTVPEDAIVGCYWARVRDFDGDVGSIISNDLLAPGARGRFTVKRTDKGIELTGDCVWTRDE